jgi:hypothetical protein
VVGGGIAGLVAARELGRAGSDLAIGRLASTDGAAESRLRDAREIATVLR